MRASLLCLSLLLPLSLNAQNAASPARIESGNRISENLPEIPAELIDSLNQYQNTRGAAFAGWTTGGCMLVSTRFAETAQVHRVCQPMGMREQLTFYRSRWPASPRRRPKPRTRDSCSPRTRAAMNSANCSGSTMQPAPAPC